MDSVHHARFPLNTAKRPKLLDVDRETVNWWKQSARQEITNLLRDRKSWFYKGKSTEEHEDLKLTYAKHDVRGYTSTGSTGAQASALSRKTNFFCEGILNLSLEDVAYGLYSAETEDQRAVNIYAFQENFLDAAVLDVYERQTMEDPFHFAGIKWVAYVIPPGLVAPADMLYFEYSCKARDADGNVVLVQYITSPELLPHQLHEHNVGLARAKVSQISTFRFLEEGTHCQSAGTFEGNITVPAWITTKSVQQFFTNMAHLVGLADARAIASLGKASAISTSKACYLCSKKFGMMRTRHNCHSCGQSICIKCTIKLKIFNSPATSPKHSKKHSTSSQRHPSSSAPKFSEDRFCLPCVLQAREQRSETGSFSGMVDSISSEESNATAPPSVDEDYEVDFSDLHDAIDDIDDHRSASFDRHKRRKGDKKHPHDELTSAKLMLFNRSQHPAPPKAAYPSRAKAGVQATPAAVTKQKRMKVALRTMESQHQPTQSDEPAAAPLPMPAAFSKLSESIAAQEALLQTIKQERSKFHARQQAQTLEKECADNGRFEVIADTPPSRS